MCNVSRLPFEAWRGWRRGLISPSSRSNGSNVNAIDSKDLKSTALNSTTISPPEDHYLDIMSDDYTQMIRKAHSLVHDRCTSILQALVGREILVTALSADVVNSSQKIKTLSSEAKEEYYKMFIENTSELIQDHGGYVLKNVGDCVLGFFPSGKHFAENHDSAVSCGLAIRDMIQNSLSPHFVGRKLPSIACRIGADFGSSRVSRLTSNGGYSAVDMFGDVINAASKISHYAKPNQMVIGYNLLTHLMSMDCFDFKPTSHFDLIGKRDYEVYVVDYRK